MVRVRRPIPSDDSNSSSAAASTESQGSTATLPYVQDMSLKHLKIEYDGLWLPCDEFGITWAGNKSFFVHNVDPKRIELARLFQLVIKEARHAYVKPERCWYLVNGVPWPHCIKPLHTAEHMREMFRNMESVGSDWGFVYFQQREKIMGNHGRYAYELPPPLCDVPTYDGIENLHQHAALIQGVMDVLTAEQLDRLYELRQLPFVSSDGPDA